MGAFQDVSSCPCQVTASAKLFCVKLGDLLLQILPELLDGDRQDRAQQKNDLLIDYSKQAHMYTNRINNHLFVL